MWKKVSGFDSRVTMWSDEDAKIRVFDLSEIYFIFWGLDACFRFFQKGMNYPDIFIDLQTINRPVSISTTF